jgi:hypothetical protein
VGRLGLSICLCLGIASADPLPPALIVEEAPPPHPARRVPLGWRSCPEGECADADAGPLTAKLRRKDGLLSIALEWTKPEWVHRVAVELPLVAGDTRLVGRDLRQHAAKRALLGRFDPKWLQVGAATVVVDDDLDEVALDPSGRITLELDAAAARPFVHDARCAKKWRDPNRHVAVPLRLHVPGDRLTARVQILERPVPPLIKSAWPDGRRSALVFTDHADQTTLRTLTVLAHHFAAHHVVMTKALFARGTDRPQLEDPRMVALADEMLAAGDEIVPHSATPNPDDRAVTQAALDQFERWHARTWIDHQPETNCEAFGDEGYQAGGRFGIADLLASHHYDYVWAEDDAPAGDLNLLSPAHLEQRAPTVWPLGRVSLGGPSSLWMFRTMWAFIEAKRFYALYGADKLDRLERERGLHIAHTYLDTYHPRRTLFGMKNVIVPVEKTGVPGGPGEVTLDARMDALLGELEARQKRGGLWVPTLAQLADRMRLVASMTVTVQPDGSYLVRAPAEVVGATFVVPEVGVNVLVGGKPPMGIEDDEGETRFVTDLPAGETIIQVRQHAAP